MKGVTIYRQSFRFRTPKGLHSISISCVALAALVGLQSKSLEQTVCCEEETTKSQNVDVKLISQQSRHEEASFGKSNFLHRILTNSLRISFLPLPRIIQPADNTFEWPALKRGLRQRLKDEESIKMLQQKAEDAVKSGDPNQIRKVLAAICEVAYGKGVTPQDRQDFLIVRSPYGNWLYIYLSKLILFHDSELGRNMGVLLILRKYYH